MRLLRAWLGLALVVLALPARANTVVQGMATVTAGYNTNPTGTVVARGDFYDDIRPGLRLTSLFERGLFYAQYTFDALMYLNHGAASGYSNDVSVGTLLVTSRTTSLTLTAGVLQSQLNNIQALQASAAAPVVVIPSGTAQFLTARAAEGLSWDFTPRWRLSQLSTFTAFLPFDATARHTFDLNNLVDLGRTWRSDYLALQLRIDYIDFPQSTAVGGAIVAEQQQLLNALSVRWLHDFGSFFSTELMVGLLLAMRADDGGGDLVTPVGRAALHYRRLEGSVDLSYDHTADASVFSGATFINDTLALHGGLPLGARSRMTLGASLAYQHGNIYDANLGRVTTSTDLWLADLSWIWSPWREMSLFARYTFTDQLGSRGDSTPTDSFMRHICMVGITIVYPAQAAAPAGFRSSVRADRSDAVEIPALHAPAEQKQPQR